jgi:hypothetical protein
MKAEGGFVKIWAKALDIEPNDDVETVCEGIRTKPIDSPVQNSNGYVPHVQLQLQKDCDCMDSEVCMLQFENKKRLLSDVQEKELKSKIKKIIIRENT